MIKAAFLAEMDMTNAQDDDASSAIAADYDPLAEVEDEDLDEMLARLSEEEVDMPKINIPAIASKIEDSPKIDVIASKVQNNPKAMDALNKLASMYGLNQMNELDSSDFSSIEMAAKEFASTLQEMGDNDDASLTAAGVLGGPLLLAIPGLMEFIHQAIPAADSASGDSLIFLASVVAGVAIGNILDRIKNANESVNEAAEDEATDIEDEVDVDVDAEEETTDGGEEEANDSIVIDKKIVSLSSLPSETRKILDTLETLRAQAEEFGDQKFITQVGNTITFFTRDFVVAGDAPTMAKVDEGNKQYYKDAEADDAEHIKALEKDMKDDKKSSMNESVVFPLWNSIKG